MSQIMYQFPINDALYRDFLAVAKQLNRTDAQLMRELMADFVRQQTAPQTQSIAQVLGETTAHFVLRSGNNVAVGYQYFVGIA